MFDLAAYPTEKFVYFLNRHFRADQKDMARLGDIFRTLLAIQPPPPTVVEKVEAIKQFWRNNRDKLPPTLRDHPDPGMLKALGYHVQGDAVVAITPNQRRLVLDYVLTGDTLPPIWSEKYMQEWGEPKSAERYSKLDNWFSYYLEKAKEDETRYGRAALRWSADRDWLRELALEVGANRLATPEQMEKMMEMWRSRRSI